MRVLFVDQFSDLGGAQLVLRDVIADARRRGWYVEVLAPGAGGLFDYCAEQGIPHTRFPIGNYANGRKRIGDVLRYGFDMAAAARAVRSIVNDRRIDLVFANGPRILPAVTNVGCPVVVHLHSHLEKWYARAIFRWSVRRVGATVICVSESVAARVRGPVQVIYNGVADLGYRAPRFREAQVRVGIIGRIAPEKGHLDFIRAARILRSSGNDVRFTIHGAGLFSDPAFERRARELAAGGPVDFCGWSDDISKVLHDLDVLAVPSAASEATPRVIMEALSAGTPVVAYTSGGIPEIIQDGFTGVLTAAKTHVDLARSIEDLLADSGRMAALSWNGRREWERRFRLERFQQEICELLERRVKKCSQSEATAAVGGKGQFV